MGVDEVLQHYGIPKRSGRYPYGSGKDPSDKSPRGKIIAATKQKIRDDVEKYDDGGMEASERFFTYAYQDAVAIAKANFGNDPSKWTKAQKEKGAELEEELLAYYDEYIDIVLTEMKDKLKHSTVLKHYGMPKRSGRYPWGSGADPDPSSPRGKTLSDRVKDGAEKVKNLLWRPKQKTGSVKTASKVLRDKTEFDKLSTKELQDLVLRVGLESNLRRELARNAEENRGFVSKTIRSIGGTIVTSASDFVKKEGSKYIRSKVEEYLKGKGPAEEVKNAVNDGVKAAKQAAETINNSTKGGKTFSDSFRDMMSKRWQDGANESFASKTRSSDIIDLVESADGLFEMPISTALAIYDPKKIR